MKKITVFLLCVLMIVSLVSCGGKENDKTGIVTSDNAVTTAPPSLDSSNQGSGADYGKILDIYRYIIKVLPSYNDYKGAMDEYCAELGLVDKEEKQLFSDIFGSVFEFSKKPPYEFTCGYAIKDLNGDGVCELVLLNNDYKVMAVFSYSDGSPVLIDYFWQRKCCYIDENGLLYESGSNGADRSTVAVYKIADGGAKKELVVEFGTNGHEWSGDVAYTKYYKSENGEKKDITEAEYKALGERYGKYLSAEATKERSGLEFTSLYTENELVQAVYRLVLRDYIWVRDANTNEDTPLSAYKINNKPLSEIDGATYSYVDLDGDSIFELVIDCGEALVLRATKEAVYVYPFVIHKIRDLETDGSYYHSNTENGFEYGESKLYIEGDELKTKEIWRIVGDGERYAERGEAFYYIEGREVARDELLRYYNNIRGKFENTEKIPLIFVNKLPISSESAWKTASEHFGVKDGAQEGAAGTLMTHRIVLLSKPTPDKAYYHFGHVIESKGSSFLGADALPASEVRIYKEVYVDALTGNCFDVNKYDPDGKG